MKERNSLLISISKKLKNIASLLNVAVIVTNEVSDYFNLNQHAEHGTKFITSGREVQPCLGLTWKTLIDSGVLLSIRLRENSVPWQRISSIAQ